VNYGALPANAETVLRGACPIVGSYGRKDRSLRGAAGGLERVLDTLGVEHDIVEYADAGHSFLNDHHSILYRAMGPFGIGYHEPSTRDARRPRGAQRVCGYGRFRQNA
jgi:carboxymethylenebutenolidase